MTTDPLPLPPTRTSSAALACGGPGTPIRPGKWQALQGDTQTGPAGRMTSQHPAPPAAFCGAELNKNWWSKPAEEMTREEAITLLGHVRLAHAVLAADYKVVVAENAELHQRLRAREEHTA